MREFGAVLELIKHERGSFALSKKIGIETRALGALQVRAQRGDSGVARNGTGGPWDVAGQSLPASFSCLGSSHAQSPSAVFSLWMVKCERRNG